MQLKGAARIAGLFGKRDKDLSSLQISPWPTATGFPLHIGRVRPSGRGASVSIRSAPPHRHPGTTPIKLGRFGAGVVRWNAYRLSNGVGDRQFQKMRADVAKASLTLKRSSGRRCFQSTGFRRWLTSSRAAYSTAIPSHRSVVVRRAGCGGWKCCQRPAERVVVEPGTPDPGSTNKRRHHGQHADLNPETDNDGNARLVVAAGCRSRGWRRRHQGRHGFDSCTYGRCPSSMVMADSPNPLRHVQISLSSCMALHPLFLDPLVVLCGSRSLSYKILTKPKVVPRLRNVYESCCGL